MFPVYSVTYVPGLYRGVANVIILSAGVAAAYVIVTTPSLRRLAFRATRIWLGSSMLAYLVNTTPGVVEAAPPV
jgi:hypothetical protein